jgi:hypothetical protein
MLNDPRDPAGLKMEMDNRDAHEVESAALWFVRSRVPHRCEDMSASLTSASAASAQVVLAHFRGGPVLPRQADTIIAVAMQLPYRSSGLLDPFCSGTP